ncbi:GMP synthase [glutamine-hydrolyzing] subunit A [Candidatus Burarchaeum australiense]|nr:GMP synthase [glutamine-hydrolyzing] subunit A [Candidatus Burarchaeum australiense]
MVNIAVVKVGGQYNHLIMRSVIDAGEESELVPLSITLHELAERGFDGVVMGGGPQRIGSEQDKLGNLEDIIKNSKVPVLALCVAHQLIAPAFGGKAGPAKQPEFGAVDVFVDDEDELLAGMGPSFKTVQSHNDEIIILPKGFEVLAHSEKCKYQVIRHATRPLFGAQFHAETMQGEKDEMIFRNFVEICRKHSRSGK